MKNIVITDILLKNNGKEFDTGTAIKKTVSLLELTKDEAIDAFKSGKRVYFVYKNNRIYHKNCRKICNNLNYLKAHYDLYHECCGVLMRSKEV